jgi:hypothetical protein
MPPSGVELGASSSPVIASIGIPAIGAAAAPAPAVASPVIEIAAPVTVAGPVPELSTVIPLPA